MNIQQAMRAILKANGFDNDHQAKLTTPEGVDSKRTQGWRPLGEVQGNFGQQYVVIVKES